MKILVYLFVGFLYEGHFYPPPHPDLHIQFTFEDATTNTLMWWRDGEPGYCARRANYRYENGILFQETTWVDPKNRSDCSQDVDMLPGRKTYNKADFDEKTFSLYLNLNDKDLIYVFKRTEETQN